MKTLFHLLSSALIAITLAPGWGVAQAQTTSDCDRPRADWSAKDMEACLSSPRKAPEVSLARGVGVGSAATTAAVAAPPAVAMQVLFDINSAQLRPAALPLLTNLAEALKSDRLKGQSFQLVGHTDVTGPLDLNLALSMQRAQRVRTFLLERGVEASRLSASGMGPKELLPNLPPESELHRRVVVQLKR